MRASRPLTACICLVTLVALAIPAYALTPGELDPTFGQGGKATALSQGGVGYAVTLDGQGRVVTAGYTLNGRPNFVVARFLQNGTLDTTFGDLGRTILDLGGADYAYALAIQTDGKIVLAGESDLAGRSRMAVARFNANGRVDTTFGGHDGFVLTSFGKDQQAANAVVFTPDDKIVVAGFTSNGRSTARSAMARYSIGGTLDHSFGGDGRASFDFSRSNEQFEALSWDGGNYVLAGYAEVNGVPAFSVANVTGAGHLNHQFSHNGFNTTNVSVGPDLGFAMVQQPDGKIVVAGRAANSGRDDWGSVRYTAKGGVDKSWGKSGRVITSFGKGSDAAYGIAIQANGKMVVVGRVHRTTTGADFGLVRYNTDGSINQTFGTKGKVKTDFSGGQDTARDIVITDSNRRIVVVGDAVKNGVRKMALARYVE
ncbi:MAG: hypothetical protein QOI81_1861 [Actinomycetota bacterium]|nr:hypothetical protein [Actinomycetota bacterium]